MFEKSTISVMQNQTKRRRNEAENGKKKKEKYRKMTETVAVEWEMRCGGNFFSPRDNGSCVEILDAIFELGLNFLYERHPFLWRV